MCLGHIEKCACKRERFEADSIVNPSNCKTAIGLSNTKLTKLFGSGYAGAVDA